MTLYDAIAAELPGLRAAAESRMISTCIVRRKTGEYVPQDDGREVPEWVEVHEGRMRLRGARSGASGSTTQSLPGGEVVYGTPEAHFPHDVTVLADGDLIDVTEGERAGTVWRIVNADAADQQTALRLPVEAVERPEEW